MVLGRRPGFKRKTCRGFIMSRFMSMSRVKNELDEVGSCVGFELGWWMEVLELVFELNFEFCAGFWQLKFWLLKFLGFP